MNKKNEHDKRQSKYDYKPAPKPKVPKTLEEVRRFFAERTDELLHYCSLYPGREHVMSTLLLNKRILGQLNKLSEQNAESINVIVGIHS